jgi:hypothetical protein
MVGNINNGTGIRCIKSRIGGLHVQTRGLQRIGLQTRDFSSSVNLLSEGDDLVKEIDNVEGEFFSVDVDLATLTDRLVEDGV